MKITQNPPVGLTDWAYATIKDSILNLELRMGEQIGIDGLCDDLQISRTPIREALLRLELDGLVESVPRVGFFVTEITRGDLEELFEIRALLESYAAKKAARMLSQDEIERIEELLEVSCEAVEANDMQKFLEYEADLHSAITKGAGNSHLAKLMEGLEDLTHRERALSVQVPGNVEQSCIEHRRFVKALRERDAQRAGTQMWEHILAVRERMLAYFDEMVGMQDGQVDALDQIPWTRKLEGDTK